MDPMGIATRFLKQFLWFSIMTGGLVLNILLKWPPLVQVSKFILKWAGMRTTTGSRFFSSLSIEPRLLHYSGNQTNHWIMPTIPSLNCVQGRRCARRRPSLHRHPTVEGWLGVQVTESSDVFGTKRDRRKNGEPSTLGGCRWRVFFGWTVWSKETQTGSNSRRDGWVLSVEILLDFGVLRRRNTRSCTIVGFPPQVYQGTPTHCCW